VRQIPELLNEMQIAGVIENYALFSAVAEGYHRKTIGTLHFEFAGIEKYQPRRSRIPRRALWIE
jgi:hypothetical protein